MANRPSVGLLLGIIFLSLGVLVALTWANYRFVLQNPGGVDFSLRWIGTRSLIFNGDSPYSDSVRQEFYDFVYGGPLLSDDHELFFSYPLYTVVLFVPFALVEDYLIARAVWMTTLEVFVVLSAIFSLRLVRWRPKAWLLITILIFSMLWYHSIRTLVNGNVVMIVAFFIVVALYAIRTGRDELAGILLALMTIKPNVVLVFILFALIWSISRKRWRLIGWAIGSELALIILCMFIIPDWLTQYITEVLRYSDYSPPGTVGAAFMAWWPGIGIQMTVGINLLMIGILLKEWRGAWNKDFNWFLWTVCLTLVVRQWISIQTDPGNFIVLFPSLVLVFMGWKERWSINKAYFLILGSMFFLFVGLWTLFFLTVGTGEQPQQHLVMFFPLPLFLIIALYWVKPIVVKPHK